jgi:hypothetical protein
MTRAARKALERKLEQIRRLALEPTDARARKELTQIIEELEFRIQDGSAESRGGGRADLHQHLRGDN